MELLYDQTIFKPNSTIDTPSNHRYMDLVILRRSDTVIFRAKDKSFQASVTRNKVVLCIVMAQMQAVTNQVGAAKEADSSGKIHHASCQHFRPSCQQQSNDVELRSSISY